MRDVGIIIWAVVVFIGVISSIASSVRRQRPGSRPARPYAVIGSPYAAAPPPPAPPVMGPRRTAPARPSSAPPPSAAPRPAAKVVTTRPAPESHAMDWPAAPRSAPRAFSGRSALAHAVIAAEVLGKPLALRDE